MLTYCNILTFCNALFGTGKITKTWRISFRQLIAAGSRPFLTKNLKTYSLSERSSLPPTKIGFQNSSPPLPLLSLSSVYKHICFSYLFCVKPYLKIVIMLTLFHTHPLYILPLWLTIGYSLESNFDPYIYIIEYVASTEFLTTYPY